MSKQPLNSWQTLAALGLLSTLMWTSPLVAAAGPKDARDSCLAALKANQADGVQKYCSEFKAITPRSSTSILSAKAYYVHFCETRHVMDACLDLLDSLGNDNASLTSPEFGRWSSLICKNTGFDPSQIAQYSKLIPQERTSSIGRACRMLAMHLRLTVGEDSKEASVLDAKACKLHDAVSCISLAREQRLKGRNDEAITLLKPLCHKDLHLETDRIFQMMSPKGCKELGFAYLSGHQYKLAEQVLSYGCSQKLIKACFNLPGCRSAIGEACGGLGALFVSQDQKAPGKSKLELSCSLGSPLGCALLKKFFPD